MARLKLIELEIGATYRGTNNQERRIEKIYGSGANTRVLNKVTKGARRGGLQVGQYSDILAESFLNWAVEKKESGETMEKSGVIPGIKPSCKTCQFMTTATGVEKCIKAIKGEICNINIDCISRKFAHYELRTCGSCRHDSEDGCVNMAVAETPCLYDHSFRHWEPADEAKKYEPPKCEKCKWHAGEVATMRCRRTIGGGAIYGCINVGYAYFEPISTGGAGDAFNGIKIDIEHGGDMPKTAPPVVKKYYNMDQAGGIKDSGNRRQFDSGAVRDMAEGKGRMDLLPWAAIMELSKHCENGAKKYGERNIDKGLPVNSLIDSAFRHLAKYMEGATDEPHLLAAFWNVAWAVQFEKTIPSMQNIPARMKAEVEA